MHTSANEGPIFRELASKFASIVPDRLLGCFFASGLHDLVPGDQLSLL
jgi:hypothetical protein